MMAFILVSVGFAFVSFSIDGGVVVPMDDSAESFDGIWLLHS